MSNTSLVPFPTVKKIIEHLNENNILSYDAAVGTQLNPLDGQQEIQMLDLKIAFTTQNNEEDAGSGSTEDPKERGGDA